MFQWEWSRNSKTFILLCWTFIFLVGRLCNYKMKFRQLTPIALNKSLLSKWDKSKRIFLYFMKYYYFFFSVNVLTYFGFVLVYGISIFLWPLFLWNKRCVSILILISYVRCRVEVLGLPGKEGREGFTSYSHFLILNMESEANL